MGSTLREQIPKLEPMGSDPLMNPDIAKQQAVYQEWRHHLHKHPELSGSETNTVQFIQEKLTEFDVPHRTLAGGVVGWLKNGTGTARGLRADIDALPIHETNRFTHRSMREGVMHACGHDGHTTMLLGAAQYLAAHLDTFQGTIYFIFQPAEEVGNGAENMIAAGLFNTYPMETIYGMHNWPGLPIGHFVTHSNVVMAAVKFFDIKIKGSGGHAAMPHLTRDPIVAGSQLVTALQTIASRRVDPNDAMVLSITSVQAGDAYNVIPAELLLKGTVRYFRDEVYKSIHQQIKNQLTALNSAGFETEFITHNSVPATINDPQQAEFTAQVAIDMLGDEDKVLRYQPPSMGAEDFAYMLQAKPGSYVWLGNGGTSGLHAPDYDFNDDALVYGVNYWVDLAQKG